MEARTGLVIGGMAAVAASIAVVTAVALANTAALADAPGTSVSAGRVIVPAAPTPTITPRATAPATAPTPTPDVAPPAASGPETVSAPDPVVVDRPGIVVDEAQVTPPVAPAAPAAPAAPPAAPPADLDTVIAAAKAAGTWDALRRWAAEHGWSNARLDQLVSRLEQERSGQGGQEWLPSPGEESSDRQGLGGGSSTSDRDSGWKRTEQGKNPPERPAHAGSNAGHGDDAGPGTKKDQSRDSPDRRD